MGLFRHLEKKFGKISIEDSQDQIAPNSVQSPPPPIPARNYTESNNNVMSQKTIIHATNVSDGDLFSKPIASNAPPVSCIQSTNVHPVHLPRFYDNASTTPIETNNFYGNMLVEEQNLPVWTHPYSVWKCLDDQFKGLGISHTSAAQRVFGEDPNSDPVKYFFNPVGICSLMLSAAEFQEQNYDFEVGECKRFSIGLQFKINNGFLRTKLVQGMGFITGIYENQITPKIASKVGIQSWDFQGTLSNGLNKNVLTLFDQTRWIVYSSIAFQQESPHSFIGTSEPSNGSPVIVQVAKLTDGRYLTNYDQAAGSYPTDCTLSGTVADDQTTANYSFNYSIEGQSTSNQVLQWFLPHHYLAADSDTLSTEVTGFELDSTVKGRMHAFVTSNFNIIEQLPPKELMFGAWSEKAGVGSYSDEAKQVIYAVATKEINEFDVVNQSNTDSMYTAGKILDKGAFMLYTAAFVLQDNELTKIMLEKMKQAFDRFINNRQQAPLVYETNWKGIVSTSGLNDGNFYCDFGNCFYNDHHFHYGYHIHAAAVVALVDSNMGDGSWVTQSKQWVETLIRDVFNPSDKDSFFPVFRSFDFYNGHSFANGLFAHGDGKDEESSSEDYHCYYGIKLWGAVTNNTNLSSLASLVLSIERRAMGMYMLFKHDNTIMPSNFIRNKVSGILFENKIDHATYFGMNKEYIHGIHMIPLTPMSNFIRTFDFCHEEWNEMDLGGLANAIDGGWKGLLMLNCALINPKQAWDFFSQQQFDYSWLDNGMSRTWSLAYCAGMGGA